MLNFLLRLDDACPTMHPDNWGRMEKLLEKYGVRPIVGVIPDCQDPAPDFQWPEEKSFWERVIAWQNKGWCIAQHGLHHKFFYHEPGIGYFQKSHGTITEYAGLSFEEQKKSIKTGNDILHRHGIHPSCFFAPAHTYDENTVKVCREIPDFKFISDGYALRPFVKNGMVFVPSIFDGPHKVLPFGTYTFICHPSKMESSDFERLEKFLQKNATDFINVDTLFSRIKPSCSQGIVGTMIESTMFYVRAVRKKVKG